MSDKVTARPTGDPVRRPQTALLATVLIVLAGCTTPDWVAVPDWADPTEWLAEDAPAAEPGSAETPIADGDGSYPNLASVPDNPPAASSETERREIADSLVADRTNARYTDQKLRAIAPDEPVTRPSTQAAVAEQSPITPPAPPPTSQPTTPRVPTQSAQADQAPIAPSGSPPPARSSVAVPTPLPASPTPMIAAMTRRHASGDTRPPRLSAGEAAPLASMVAPPAPPPSAVSAIAPPPPPPLSSVPSSDSLARAAAPLPPAVVPPAPRSTDPMLRKPAAVAVPPPPSTAAVPLAAYPPLVATPPGGGQLTAPPVLPPAPGQDVLAQVYAQQLRASGGTTLAGPGNPRFAAPAARPLSDFATPVPPIVQNTYNESLVRSMPPGGLAGSVSGATRGPYGPVAAMVTFANGASRLSAKARRQIKQVADLVKARGGAVRVVGHASSRTKELPVAQHVVANFNVSLARGQAVARELIRHGVPPRSIFVEAKGDGQPRYLESMPSGEARNRRVEIFLVN